jgi:hypothetical protein
MAQFLAETVEAPHPICTQMDVGMNARELMIACPVIPTSMALGKLGKYEETSKSAISHGIIVLVILRPESLRGRGSYQPFTSWGTGCLPFEAV